MKKIISLTLAVLMLVAVFSACGNNTTVNTGETLPYDIGDDGMFVYSVTRADGASTPVETAAKQLRTDMKKGFGCNIVILKDTVEDFDNNYEILVGVTNREETVEAYEKVKNNRPNNNKDFYIKVIGDKICIAAVTDDMIDVACKWFAKTFCGSIDDWKKLYPGYEFLYTPENDSVIDTVAGENIGSFTAVVPQKWSYLGGREVDKIIATLDTMGFPIEKRTELGEETEYEMLFGDMEREASKSVTVSGDDFIIKVIGKKIVVKGGNDLATQTGIAAFHDLIKQSISENKGFSLEDGYVLNGKYDKSAPNAYTLNFDDEFNGSTLNTKYWTNFLQAFDGLDKAVGTSCLGGSTFEARYDDKNYINVSGGNLVMTTAKINDTDFVKSHLSTYASMIYRYGFWEVCLKFGKAPGAAGLWNNASYLGMVKRGITDADREAFTEIDLLENFGYETYYASNVHRWWEGMDAAGNVASMGHTSLDADGAYNIPENDRRYRWKSPIEGDESTLADDFHIYTYYWDNERMEFAFDGQKYCDFDYAKQTNSVSIHCMQNFLVFDQGMGDTGYGVKWKEGDPEKSISYTDWTRIYQTDAINSLMTYGQGYQESGKYSGTPTYVYPESHRSY